MFVLLAKSQFTLPTSYPDENLSCACTMRACNVYMSASLLCCYDFSLLFSQPLFVLFVAIFRHGIGLECMSCRHLFSSFSFSPINSSSFLSLYILLSLPRDWQSCSYSQVVVSFASLDMALPPSRTYHGSTAEPKCHFCSYPHVLLIYPHFIKVVLY